MILSTWMRRALLSSVTFGALAIMTTPGCIKKQASAVMLQVSSDLIWVGNIPPGSPEGTAELTSITIEGERDGNVIGPYTLTAADKLPARFSLYNNPDLDRPNSVQARMTVKGTGSKNGKPFTVTGVAVFEFPNEELKLVDVQLAASCADLDTGNICDDDTREQTCTAGGCQPALRDVGQLPNFPPPEIQPDSVCFDPTTQGCFSGAVAVIPSLDGVAKKAPCSLPLSSDFGIGIDTKYPSKNSELNPAFNPHLNLAFTWGATGSRYLVLDRDSKTPFAASDPPRYGWRLGLVKDDKGGSEHLAIIFHSELCSQFTANGIALVAANPAKAECASKDLDQLYCNGKEPTNNPATTSFSLPKLDCSPSSLSVGPGCQACIDVSLKTERDACSAQPGCIPRVNCAIKCTAGDVVCGSTCLNLDNCGAGRDEASALISGLASDCKVTCSKK